METQTMERTKPSVKKTPIEKWEDNVIVLCKKVVKSERTFSKDKFDLGDLILSGKEKKYVTQGTYERFEKETGIKEGTLQHYATDAKRVEKSIRRLIDLPYEHHSKVAVLWRKPKVQSALLEKAVKFNWSSSELGEHVKEELPKDDDDTAYIKYCAEMVSVLAPVIEVLEPEKFIRTKFINDPVRQKLVRDKLIEQKDTYDSLINLSMFHKDEMDKTRIIVKGKMEAAKAQKDLEDAQKAKDEADKKIDKAA